MESIHNVLFVPFSSIYFYQNSFSTSEPEDVSIQSTCISGGVTILFLILLGGKKRLHRTEQNSRAAGSTFHFLNHNHRNVYIERHPWRFTKLL